jgi:hypothetical protein
MTDSLRSESLPLSHFQAINAVKSFGNEGYESNRFLSPWTIILRPF